MWKRTVNMGEAMQPRAESRAAYPEGEGRKFLLSEILGLQNGDIPVSPQMRTYSGSYGDLGTLGLRWGPLSAQELWALEIHSLQ